MRAEDLLRAVGVDPDQSPAEAVALCMRSMPVRKKKAGDEASLEEIFERGYFEGLAECRHALEFFSGGEVQAGSAFGISWPWARIEGALLAPGIPVRLLGAEEAGPDGVYRLEGNDVLREAAGRSAVILECTETGPDRDLPFDLLCFGPMERYLLENGRLRIEDLFCRLDLPVSGHDLDRIFVRAQRLDPKLIEGLPDPEFEENADSGVLLSIARQVETEFFPDPAAFLGIRADVQEISRQGEFLKLESLRGETALFQIDGDMASWQAELKEGRYPLIFIRCERNGGLLHLEVRPSDDIDLLAPGKRGRLAFDLHSDCVMLARQAEA